jgi:hypothetical protein
VPDALVVGGCINDRLTHREALRAEGFRVTLERSALRGLTQLQRHRYLVCALDPSGASRPKTLTQHYARIAAARGTELRVAGT